jgi:predicted RNase H-like HicB family nuclease
MPDLVSDLLARPYRIEIAPDEDTAGGLVFVARHPELEGCEAHGATPEEALANLREARELYIRVLVTRGIEVSPPTIGRHVT